MSEELIFNPPPGWPTPPQGWRPPKGWSPDPCWPPPPQGWQLWIPIPQNGVRMEDHCVDVKDVEAKPTHDACVVDRASFLEAENRDLKMRLESALKGGNSVVHSDDRVLQEVGIYIYHHPLENAAAYQERLKKISGEVASIIMSGHAIEMSSAFTYDNSLAQGRRMSADLGKLMLRAYNAEVDNSIRSMRAGNVHTARRRIESSREAIAKLGKMMEMRISDAFHRLRLEEVELVSDFLAKKQEDRELAREERARLREERRVAAELAAEREQLEKERGHIMNALESLRSKGVTDSDLEGKLEELDQAISQNDFRAANIRAGYVYIVSNRGAFGPNVVKIGLTRRLEPLNRIDELGGASVPFRFDVHGLFFSEDAVTLEAELHKCFATRRLNQANLRKEFFFATPAEIREVLRSKMGNLLEFTEHAEAEDFLRSVHYWPEDQRVRFDYA